MKEKTLNKVKKQFSPSSHGDKINAELKKNSREQIENLQSEICFEKEEMKKKKYSIEIGSPREMTLSFPVYRQCQCKNGSEKTPFHEQNLSESSQEQFTDPSNRGTSKDHHTNLIPPISIKHPTSCAGQFRKQFKHSGKKRW